MQPNGLLSSKAVLYARVSSKEQHKREGYSIPAQCNLLRSSVMGTDGRAGTRCVLTCRGLPHNERILELPGSA